MAARTPLGRISKRRIALVSVGATVLALWLGASSVSAANTPAYWQQYGADAANSNHTNDTALTPTAVANLAPEFSLAATPDFTYCDRTIGVPVANATSLFVFDGTAITAVNLSTGRQTWRTPLVTQESPADAHLMALYGSTLIVGELLECDSPSDPDGEIAAYNVSNGKLLWTQSFDNPPVFTMELSGSTIIDSGEDAYASAVEARSASTGALRWSRQGCYAYFVVGAEVVTDCGGLSVSTGALLWAKTGWTYWRGDGPGVTNPQIYATDPSGHLTALNANGGTVWSSTTEKGPVLAAGATRIYVRCDSGALCALNRTTGARQWKDPNDNPSAVVLAGNLAYPIPGNSALNVDTGAPVPIGADLTTAGAAQISNGHLLIESGRILDVYSLQ